MTIFEAADALNERLEPFRWFSAVGVGGTGEHDAIVVYVKSLSHPELEEIRAGWMGYPVEVLKMGQVYPAA